jgi:hypothetical protein
MLRDNAGIAFDQSLSYSQNKNANIQTPNQALTKNGPSIGGRYFMQEEGQARAKERGIDTLCLTI